LPAAVRFALTDAEADARVTLSLRGVADGTGACVEVNAPGRRAGSIPGTDKQSSVCLHIRTIDARTYLADADLERAAPQQALLLAAAAAAAAD